jgi:hypothetical protein
VSAPLTGLERLTIYEAFAADLRTRFDAINDASIAKLDALATEHDARMAKIIADIKEMMA